MRVLFLSRWFPWPADNGSRLRVRALLEALAAEADVDLISFSETPPAADDMAQARALCRSVEALPYHSFEPRALSGWHGALGPEPRSVRATHSPALAAAAQRAAAAHSPHLVIASQIDMAPYARRIAGAPRLLEELELGALAGECAAAPSRRSRMRQGLTWWKLQRYVRALLPDFAACTVASPVEAALVRAVAPHYRGRLAVVPNGVRLPDAPPPSAPRDPNLLVYTGAVTYDANLDAVRYFAEEILPRVRALRPQVRLLVTGRTGSVDVRHLAAQGVEFTGHLTDLGGLLAAAGALVVPLRVGGGTRLKVLEGMAAGVPVISTTKGIEGLELEPGRDLLVADGADAFAAAVLRLLDDAALRDALAARGPAAVAAYDWRIIGPRFVELAHAAARMPAHGEAWRP